MEIEVASKLCVKLEELVGSENENDVFDIFDTFYVVSSSIISHKH